MSSVVRLSPPQLPCLGECVVLILPSTLAWEHPLPSLSLSWEAPLSQCPLCLARGFPMCLQPCRVLSSGSTSVHLGFLASLSTSFCKSSGLSHVCVTQSFFLLPRVLSASASFHSCLPGLPFWPVFIPGEVLCWPPRLGRSLCHPAGLFIMDQAFHSGTFITSPPHLERPVACHQLPRRF